MRKLILFALLLSAGISARAQGYAPGLQVEVTRDGSLYTFQASFDTSLTRCAAYRYLTDYQDDKDMPGVIESHAYRESASQVRVERIVDEHILFFDVRLHSVVEYTESPFDRIAFTQLAGDSKSFQGSWTIQPERQGSMLKFKGVWEPDTLIPLFIIDHFAKNGLIDKFNTIASMAEKHAEKYAQKPGDIPANSCVD